MIIGLGNSGFNYGYSSAVSSNHMSRNDMVSAIKSGHTEGISDAQIRSLKRAGAVECSTCASRKYKDGSNENVSFKAASHVSPQASGAAVRAHEQEHVNNAYDKAQKGNGKVLQASGSIKTAVCPECGRSYTAGGTTATSIKYDESNPYMKNKKGADYEAMVGKNIDYAV